jgi:hypothetical protein
MINAAQKVLKYIIPLLHITETLRYIITLLTITEWPEIRHNIVAQPRKDLAGGGFFGY